MLPEVKRSNISLYCLGHDLTYNIYEQSPVWDGEWDCLELVDIAVGTKGQTAVNISLIAKPGKVELSFSLSTCNNRKEIGKEGTQNYPYRYIRHTLMENCSCHHRQSDSG